MSAEKPARTFIYKRVGQCRIGADLYRPAGTGACPLIVWIHGGALIGGTRRSLPSHQLGAYVGAGWAVLSIDYRLAPETHLPLIVGDVVDAVDWATGEASRDLSVDPTRVAVVGHSGGGYLALMLGVRAAVRPRALVSFYGYGDVLGTWYAQPDAYYRGLPLIPEADARAGVGGRALSASTTEDRWRFYRFCRQTGTWLREVAGVDLAGNPDAVQGFCPERNVTLDYPPTLLIHGDQDTDVPYSLSVSMAAALRAKDVEHELVTVSGQGHMFDLRPDQSTNAVMRRVLSFLGEQFAR